MYIREGIGLFLLLLGLLRATLLVTHDPVMGYAPQADMQRTAACSGLQPDAAPASREQVPGPFAFYKLEEPSRADCYPSTEVALDGMVLAATRGFQTEGRGIRIHWMGYAKLALLAFAALTLAWALHQEQGASLGHGILFLVVLSDPVVTLWFNTLATEFFVVWGLYAAIAAACALAIAERGAIALWALLVIAVLALAFSREQYALLPPILVALAAPWLWYRSSTMTGIVFLVAVIASSLSLTVLQRSPPPLSAGGQSAPAVFALPRTLPASPAAFAHQAAKAMPSLQGVSIDAGVVEGAKKTAVAELPWWAFSPLEAISSRESAALSRAIALATLLLAPLAIFVALLWARPTSQNIGTPLVFAMLVGVTAIYGFLTAAFGAGTPTARNFLPAAFALWVLDVGVLAALPFLGIRWYMAPRQSWKEMAIGLGGAVVYLGALVVALDWMTTHPPAG